MDRMNGRTTLDVYQVVSDDLQEKFAISVFILSRRSCWKFWYTEEGNENYFIILYILFSVLGEGEYVVKSKIDQLHSEFYAARRNIY